ncbi:hypothetical protein HK097_005371 [Rhizophlyctis rosea]|uniref:Uncharacterized protein n=1 Tax=Rhizophlyctis rosea TaxID=64517 RepID=A0AAD5X381_9FUNG|nr:hypothetical protein HK097_005371 [Rhizophlyctis rosea]
MTTRFGFNRQCELHVPTRTTTGCFSTPISCTAPQTISTLSDCSASTTTVVTMTSLTCQNVPATTSFAADPANCSVLPLSLGACPSNTQGFSSTTMTFVDYFWGSPCLYVTAPPVTIVHVIKYTDGPFTPMTTTTTSTTAVSATRAITTTTPFLPTRTAGGGPTEGGNAVSGASEGYNAGKIGGFAFLGTALVGLLAFGILWYIRKKKKADAPPTAPINAAPVLGGPYPPPPYPQYPQQYAPGQPYPPQPYPQQPYPPQQPYQYAAPPTTYDPQQTSPPYTTGGLVPPSAAVVAPHSPQIAPQPSPVVQPVVQGTSQAPPEIPEFKVSR